MGQVRSEGLDFCTKRPYSFYCSHVSGKVRNLEEGPGSGPQG